MEHSTTLSPSSAHRWMECPGSIKLSQGVPRTTNVYADKGTVAHYIGEKCITEDMPASYFIGKKGWINDKGKPGAGKYAPGPEHTSFLLDIDESLIAAIHVYVEELRRCRKLYPKAINKTEERLDISWIAEGLFGTGDDTLINPLDRIILTDYKNGTGVVDIQTPQLKIYGLGALGKDNDYMVDEIILKIVQPNASCAPIRENKMSVEELYDWAKKELIPATKRVAEALKDESLEWESKFLKSGKWCRYCPVEAGCSVNRKNKAEIMFNDENALESISSARDLMNLKNISTDELFELYDKLPQLENWISAIKAKCYNRLKSGPSNGYKLINKLGNRKFRNDSEAINHLSAYIPKENLFEYKMKSPSKMEKLLTIKGVKPKDRKKIIDPLVVRPQKDPKMVPASHKDPAIKLIDQMFKE